MITRNCRVCDVELNEENWYSSCRAKGDYICKECNTERSVQWQKANPEKAKTRSARWRKANPEKAKALWTRSSRKQGKHPFDENKGCALFLGVHIAEQVLSHVFKDVKRMPTGNPGYDFICNKGKKIDVKSACQRKRGEWAFAIKHNTTADYFLCLAFDNREDLNPLHAWLIPGRKLNHLTGASISPSTVHKWDAYKLDLSKINDCCNAMRTSI